MGFMDRLKAAYSIIADPQSTVPAVPTDGMVTSIAPSSMYYQRVAHDSSRAVLAPIVSRISMDVANTPIRHVRVDENGRYLETINGSELNDRLTLRANIDQSGVAFLQDAVTTMLYLGAVAMVPVEVSANPDRSVYEILSLRTAEITQWFNRSVEVQVYNEFTGQRVAKTLPKGYVAIAYNPLYAVMNEPNSTLRRLIDRLALLDVADGKQFSPQLDLIIQLPYTLNNERRQEAAAARMETITKQLEDSKYGVAYVDATEKITQLNRPVTNNLVETVGTLTESLHAQLGLSPGIFSGTASQEEMLAYYNRTIKPVLNAIIDAMQTTFLTRTALRQGHRIAAFPDLFKMAPLSEFATAADTFTRNAIMSTNEVRAVMGLEPSEDPSADELRNKNLNPNPESEFPEAPGPGEEDGKERSKDDKTEK